MRQRLLRTISTAGVAVSLMLGVLPQAASAQIIQTDPLTGMNPSAVVTTPQPAEAPVNGITFGVGAQDPSRHVVVNISDTGYDKSSYTVSTTSGTGNGLNTDAGTIEFKNTGTMVHTATLYPGSGNLFVAEASKQSCSRSKCASNGPLDTGGISPGQSVVVGLGYQTGKIKFSSATDCPVWGNSTAGFDCTPVSLTVKSTPQQQLISGSMEGTVRHNADGTLSLVRTLNTVKGSSKNPLTGNVTVTIDDENGYDPTTLYVLAGTTVTWVNNGQEVHAVRPRGPGPATVDWVTLLDSGGLGPGDSYSYTFDCGPDPGCRHMGAANSKFYSVVLSDRIQPRINGNSVANWDSRFMMRITTVAQPA